MVFARRVLGDSLGKDSALPKHKTITNVEPHGSQPCDVEVALHIIYVRKKKSMHECAFFLSGGAL